MTDQYQALIQDRNRYKKNLATLEKPNDHFYNLFFPQIYLRQYDGAVEVIDLLFELCEIDKQGKGDCKGCVLYKHGKWCMDKTSIWMRLYNSETKADAIQATKDMIAELDRVIGVLKNLKKCDTIK